MLKDKVVRQAIDCAIDKQKLIDMAYGGEGEVATTLINNGDFYHYEPTAAELLTNNLEKGMPCWIRPGTKILMVMESGKTVSEINWNSI